MNHLPRLRSDDFFRLFFNPKDREDFPSSPDLAVDIQENEANYKVTADLPGFDKKDIHISFDHNTLSIEGQRNEEKSEKDESGNYICRERSSGFFKRAFTLPHVDASQIQAEFKDGVLSIHLPKTQGQESKKIEIQ